MPDRSRFAGDGPAGTDPVGHRAELHRERCELFVAVTRARDALTLIRHGAPTPFLPAVPATGR